MVRVLAFGLLTAAGLYGQPYGKERFNWQNYCFKNPASPACPNHEFAVKPQPPAAKTPATRTVITNPFFVEPRPASPSLIVVGGIDWRFADPSADALVGFNFSGLSASPLARKLIAQLGAGLPGNHGLSGADMQKILDGLSSVDQVALSVRDDRIVAMVTSGSDAKLPALETGWKAVPVAGSAILIGQADAVDAAARRISTNSPLAELTRWSQERHADSDFWAIGSGRFVGPEAVSAGLTRFSLAVSMRNGFTGDAALEFNAVESNRVPGADPTRIWPELDGAAIDGNVLHIGMSIKEADMDQTETRQKIGGMASSSLGERLVALLSAARFLPVRDTNAPRQTKPVIYGLDGGPRVVNQYQDRQ